MVRSLALGVTGTGDTILFAGASGGWVFSSTNRGGEWKEIDGGTWWIWPDTGFMRGGEIYQLLTQPNGSGGICLIALADDGRLFRSINSDTNWTVLDSGIGGIHVWQLLLIDTTLFASTDSGVYQSTDRGAHWETSNNSLSSHRVYCIAHIPGSSDNGWLFAGTSIGTYRSSTNGATWNPVDTLARDYWRITVGHTTGGDLRLYAIYINDVAYSIDSGFTWIPITPLMPFTQYSVYCLAVSDTIVYAGTDAYGVFYSRDNGVTWGPNTAGMGNRTVYDLLSDGQYLFAGAASNVAMLNSVWRRPLPETITHVGERLSEEMPESFTLEQNFPNPFNPSTMISFTISSRNEISLKVYDVLGREIATLVNGERLVGQYHVRWDAEEYPSGVYYYRLTIGSAFSEMRKMILQK